MNINEAAVKMGTREFKFIYDPPNLYLWAHRQATMMHEEVIKKFNLYVQLGQLILLARSLKLEDNTFVFTRPSSRYSYLKPTLEDLKRMQEVDISFVS